MKTPHTILALFAAATLMTVGACARMGAATPGSAGIADSAASAASSPAPAAPNAPRAQ